MVLLCACGIHHTTVLDTGAFGVDQSGVGGNDLAGDLTDKVHGLLVSLHGFSHVGGSVGVFACLFEVVLAEDGYLFDIGVLKIELQTFVVAIIIHG